MYKFANGLIVYDKLTKDSLLKAGYKLIDTRKKRKKEVVNENHIDNESDISKYSENNSKIAEDRK